MNTIPGMTAGSASATGAQSAETCPVDTAIAIVAGKWKLLILRPLYLHGSLRYNALLRQVAGITAKELTRNVRELEYAGLIQRAAGTSSGSAVYELTELGRTLGPTFRALGEFGTVFLRSRRAPGRGADETV